MNVYIGQEDIGEAIAKVTLDLPDYGIATFRMYGNGYVDESFFGEAFSEPYYSPATIRMIAFELKKHTLEYLKDEEIKTFNETVWTHDAEMAENEECPCHKCSLENNKKLKLRVVK